MSSTASVWKDGYDVEPVTEIPAHFSKLIETDTFFSSIKSPTPLQSYAWPAILKRSDFFGIGPSPLTENGQGGKTSSYIIPILYELSNPALYSDPSQLCSSPFVIILCPSSKQVKGVHSQIQSLLSHQGNLPNRNIKLTVGYLFGRRHQAKKDEAVLNGMDILVCTPNCLLRVLNRRTTTMDRVSHLIFEEADLLLDNLSPQVENIIGRIKVPSSYRKSRSQCLVFSQQWTQKLNSFVLENLFNPIVIINSKMEAFYSGEIKTEIKACSSSMELETMALIAEEQLGLVSQQKILVTCATDIKAEIISKELDSLCQQKQTQKFLLNSLTEDASFNDILGAWENSTNIIIVACDERLHQIEGAMSDLTCVINTDIPKKQQVLASRFWLMRNHFQKHSNKHNEGSGLARAVLILLEEEIDSLHLPYLANFLERAGVRGPPNEMKMLKNRLMDHATQLCKNFKSFGYCSDRLHCKLRHRFHQHDDEGNFVEVPLSSIVQFQVVSVKSPFIYIAHIWKWLPKGQSCPIDNDGIYHVHRSMDICALEQYNAKPNNFVINELYIWKSQEGKYARAKLLWVDKNDITAVEAKILLIDYGDIININVAELNTYSPVLRPIDEPPHPPQAMEICVSSLKAVDHDHSWNHEDNDFVKEILLFKNLKGTVMFRVGSTLWLEDVVIDDETHETTLNLKEAMLKEGIAEHNIEHLLILRKFCGDLGYTRKKKPKPIRYTSSTEILTDTFTAVYVTSAESYKKFYVQKAVNEEMLEKLHRDIEEDFKSGEVMSVGSMPLFKGMFVWVKESRLKRAMTLKTFGADNEKANVLLVDFGISLLVNRANVFLPGQFSDNLLPFQAIECFLSDLDPPLLDEDDVVEVVKPPADFFMDMIGGTANLLTAKLGVSKEKESQGIYLFGYNDGDFVTDMKQKMILNGEELEVQAIIGLLDSLLIDQQHGTTIVKNCGSFFCNKLQDPAIGLSIEQDILKFKNDPSIGQVVKMFGNLIRYHNPGVDFSPLMRGLGIILNNGATSKYDREIKESYLFDSICCILVNGTMEAGMTVVNNLLPLLNSDYCLEEFLNKGGIKAIHCHMKIFKLNNEAILQCHCILFHLVKHLRLMNFGQLTIDENVKDRFFKHHEKLNNDTNALLQNFWRDPKPDLKNLMEIIALSMEPQHLDAIVGTSIHLLFLITQYDAHSKLSSSKIVETGCLKNMKEILETRQHDMELLKEVVFMLCHMAGSDDSVKDYLRKMEIQMTSSSDEMNLMLFELLEILNEKENEDLSTGNEDEVQLSKQLIRDFGVKMKNDADQTMISLTRGGVSLEYFTKYMGVVYWHNHDSNTLKIKATFRNVLPKSLDVKYSDKSISCKACSGEFSFHLDLCYPISTNGCSAEIHESDILFTLEKLKPGHWSHLVTYSNFYIRKEKVARGGN